MNIKHFIIASAIVAMGLSSCEKDDTTPIDPENPIDPEPTEMVDTLDYAENGMFNLGVRNRSFEIDNYGQEIPVTATARYFYFPMDKDDDVNATAKVNVTFNVQSSRPIEFSSPKGEMTVTANEGHYLYELSDKDDPNWKGILKEVKFVLGYENGAHGDNFEILTESYFNYNGFISGHAGYLMAMGEDVQTLLSDDNISNLSIKFVDFDDNITDVTLDDLNMGFDDQKQIILSFEMPVNAEFVENKTEFDTQAPIFHYPNSTATDGRSLVYKLGQ